jgi:hypothetical protein
MSVLRPLGFALFALTMAGLTLLPVLRRRDAGSPRLDVLLERIATRDRTLQELRELEFDHRAGALGDEEYAALVKGARHEAAAALHAVEQAEVDLQRELEPAP